MATVDKLREFYRQILAHQQTVLPELEQDWWKKLLEIEIAIEHDTIQTANELWDRYFATTEEFIPDVVALKIAVLSSDFHKAMDIQTRWQIILDKFDLTPELELFLGFFYLYLGVMFYSLDEYEVAANHLGKADGYFIRARFELGQYIVQDNIALCFEELGAFGDARYHLREALRREYQPTPSQVFDNKMSQVNLYRLTGDTERATKILLELYQEKSKYDRELHLLLYNELIDLFKDQGDLSNAIKFQQIGRKAYKEIYGEQ